MIKINSMIVNAPFKYLWLKSVTDVNLSEHCAKCLIGKYSNLVSPKKTRYKNLELNDGVYYLCGVSFPFNWSRNFHLAFQYCANESFEYASNGITIQVNNAVMLPISDIYIDKSEPHSHMKSYYTCRNWQFAHFYNQFLKP